MRRSGPLYSRVTLLALALAIALSLGSGPAEAGHRSHVSWSISFQHPFWFGAYWSPTFYVHSYPMGFWGQPVAVPVRDDVGAIRLRVRPKKTEVFVNGEPIGRSGQYDGYPGFLWLDEGTHTLVFYREGFRTFRRSFEVRAGMVTEVRVEMEPGEARPPEEFFGPRRPVAERPGAGPPAAPSPPRVVPPEAGGPGDSLDLRAEGARIRIAVEPNDASVYLDGRFLGTGEELARLHGGLMLDAGEHLLEVVHPDYLPDRVSFRAKAGEEIELRVSLHDRTET
jgi:hypothetical protein